MINFWSEEINYIKIFSYSHFIYVAIFLISLAILILKRNKIKEKADKLSKIFLIVSMFQQLLLYSWYYLETGFDVSEALPLQICRISSIIGIYFLVKRDCKCVDLLFCFGLFAYGSFLYPKRIYPVYHLMGISFLLNHAITLLLPYFAYIAYGWRPRLKMVLKSYLYFLIYFTIVYILNPIIDGNYFYLKYRPFLENWPDYIYVPTVLIFTFCFFIIANLPIIYMSKIHSLGKRIICGKIKAYPSSRCQKVDA